MTTISPECLAELKDIANDKIDLVLSSLGINLDEVTTSGNEIRSCCPIHPFADNPTAFCYNTTYKYWRCFTKQCHENLSNVFGLVQKVLSKIEEREITFIEAVTWLSRLVDYPLDTENYELDENQRDLTLLLRSIRKPKKTKEDASNKDFKAFPIQIIDGKIEPSPYFLKQGFDYSILKKYNVGYCNDPSKPMYMRSFAPVLSDSGSEVIGVTGRTIHPECQYCGGFHITGYGCPKDNPKVRCYPKWLHHSFKKSQTLYNLNFAEPFIRKSKTAILTEGPKDTWWFEQHKIHNSLCIFGLSVSNYHLKRLIHLGIHNIVVALDNDEPGIDAMEKIQQKFENYFNTINIKHKLGEGQDIADLNSEQMKSLQEYIKSLEAVE